MSVIFPSPKQKPHHTHVRTISVLLHDLKVGVQLHTDGDLSARVSLAQILEIFHQRGFGFFLFLLALPAALPLPGLGISFVIALPLMILTSQQMLGFSYPRFPAFITKKDMPCETVFNIVEVATPYAKFLDKMMKPRIQILTSRQAQHILGLAGLVMAISVAFPVPLTNTVPSMGIALMGIGVFVRDGLAVLAGLLIGLGWVGGLVSLLVIFGADGIDIARDAIVGLF